MAFREDTRAFAFAAAATRYVPSFPWRGCLQRVHIGEGDL